MKRDPLPELIQTLDKQEKRYLGLYLERSVGQRENDRRLFELLVKKGLSVAAAKNAVKGEPLFNSFEVCKNQLYHHLLDGLIAFHATQSEDADISDGIRKLRVLFQKKLFYQAEQLRKKLLVKAEKLNRPPFIIELLGWETRLMQVTSNLAELEKMAGLNYKKQQQQLAEQQILLQLQQLSYQHFLAVKRNWIGDANLKLEKEFKKINPAQLQSVQSKILYQQLQSTFFFSTGQATKAFKVLQVQKKLFENNPEACVAYQIQYVALLNNLNVLLMEKQAYEEVLHHLVILKAIKTNSLEKKMRITERVVNAELNIYRKQGDFIRAKNLLREYADIFEAGKFSAVYEMLYALDAAILHFTTGEYRIAIRYLNHLLNNPSKGLRPDILKAAMAMKWILWFETGKEDLLEKAIQTEKNQTDVFVNTLFAALQQLIYGGTVKTIFVSLHRELLRLNQDPLVRETYFNKFDFINWARCKAQGIVFAAEPQTKR